jgi:mRNA interferase YafQ
MLAPKSGSQFKKDVKLQKRRGKDMEKLKKIIGILLAEEPVPPEYKDHQLLGDKSAYRELHIEDDWLLAYSVDPPLLRLYRTGRHKDIFC